MKSEAVFQGGALFFAVFLLTLIFLHHLIPVLRRRRAGQPILEIGPSWHLSKAGTPTLGGVAFLVAALLAVGVPSFFLFERSVEWRALLLLVGYAVLCGLIGIFDDWKKLSRQQNKGLGAWQKYLLQLLASALFLFFAEVLFGLERSLPFFAGTLYLGALYYPFALLFLTGLVNALNLTDGVDGLLSSTVAVLAAFLLIWGMYFAGAFVFLSGCLLLGAVLGFLPYNAHPARVFMGDTGSLFLGAIVGGVGILSPSPLVLLLAAGVFLAETLSVVLQVLWFKLTHGKRLFRMAPLHHHFERIGWSEERVVAVFSAAGALFALLALWVAV